MNIKLMDVDTYDPEKLPELLVSLVPLGWVELFQYYEMELADAAKVLRRFIKRDVKICPEPYHIFKPFTLTPWWNVKAVIIGQDPYYQVDNGVPAATGSCFECRPGDPIRQSLKNIFMVLKHTVEGFEIPDSGDLSKWSHQGVLLLNATPTTESGVANAHKNIWGFFVLRVLEFLAKKRKNVVYMLWGRDARSYRASILVSSNLVLEASHPVAQGATNDFRTCDHFNECNTYLQKTEQDPIDWVL